MNRKELYAKIKECQLESVVKADFGRNYTQVSNADLYNFIINCRAVRNTSPSLEKLVEVLKKKHILLDSEVSYINS